MAGTRVWHKASRLTRSCLLLGGLVAAVHSGCGGGLVRVPVSGEVTIGGRPLDQGKILFEPAEGTEGPRAAAEIKQGRYEIPADKGPGVGKYRVEIRSREPFDFALDDPEAFAEKAPRRPPPERIAPEFNDLSTQTVTVKADGTNEFSFPVKWRPGAN